MPAGVGSEALGTTSDCTPDVFFLELVTKNPAATTRARDCCHPPTHPKRATPQARPLPSLRPVPYFRTNQLAPTRRISSGHDFPPWSGLF